MPSLTAAWDHGGGNCSWLLIASDHHQGSCTSEKDGSFRGCLRPCPSSAVQHKTGAFSVCRVRVCFCNVNQQGMSMCNCMLSKKLLLEVRIYDLICFLFQ